MPGFSLSSHPSGQSPVPEQLQETPFGAQEISLLRKDILSVLCVYKQAQGGGHLFYPVLLG